MTSCTCAPDPNRDLWRDQNGTGDEELRTDRHFRGKAESTGDQALGLQINIGRRAAEYDLKCEVAGGGGRGKYPYNITTLQLVDKEHKRRKELPKWFKEAPYVETLMKKIVRRRADN